MIWKVQPDIEVLNKFNSGTLVAHLGIEILELGDAYVKAKMPVDHRTRQPMGLLHGGASVVLSESMGSMASFLVAGNEFVKVVGLEVSASHLRAVKEGNVYSMTRPVRLGRKIHVWNTEIFDDLDHLICVSKLTVILLSEGGS